MKNLFSLFICALILCACSSDDNSNTQPQDNLGLKVVITAAITEDLDNVLGIDDIITYTISIKNIGDEILSELDMNNSFEDLEGNALSFTSGTNFVSADLGSDEGTLQVEETATYSATFTITQSEVDARGLSYSAFVSGTSPEGEIIGDVSDNGDDTDGNTSNDPTVTAIEINPTVIREYHELNADGVPFLKYYFDDYGQLYKLFYSNRPPTPGENLIYNFEFDREQKLINISKTDADDVLLESIDFIYDSQNRIVSVGELHYQYIEDDPICILQEESYTEDIMIDGDLEIKDIFYLKYDFISEINPITRVCSYEINTVYNTVTEELIESSEGCGDTFFIGYDGVNVTIEDHDVAFTEFAHDSNISPLYSTTNLINVYGFMSSRIVSGNHDPIFHLFSQNNLTTINIDGTSEIFNIEYILNTYNLPVSSTSQHTVPPDVFAPIPFGNYYYQGEEIPE